MSKQTAGPFGQPEQTTAQILGQYRRDLQAEGFDPAEVRDLVRHAAMTLHGEDGVLVSPRRGKCGCCKCAGGAS